MNNLDPDVAAAPDQLAVYSGIGKTARNQGCYRAILPELEILGNDQTLPIRSASLWLCYLHSKILPRF
jgi:urocanate hydratase